MIFFVAGLISLPVAGVAMCAWFAIAHFAGLPPMTDADAAAILAGSLALCELAAGAIGALLMWEGRGA